MKAFIRAILSVTCTCGFIAQASLISRAQSTADVLAIVNKQAITATDLEPFLPPGFDSFGPEKALAVQEVALENAISSLLLKAEARKRKISVPTLRRLMTTGRVRIPDSKVEEEFQKNSRYFGMMSPDEAKERLRLDLEAEERMKFYKTALTRLRALAKVDVKLKPPEVPRVSLIGDGPTKGPPSAAVTITIFSDFQCPYCRESQPVVSQALAQFPENVRLVFRNLPLTGLSTGLTPATAAVCASQQGLFWEYHDAAYASSTLTSTQLRRIAGSVGLDLDQFDQCLSSPIPFTSIQKDLAEARRLGITGTPTFIVNGKIYKGQISKLTEIIENEVRSFQKKGKDID